MYEYAAKVVKIYDGDTITVDIDLGFGNWRHGEKIRLLGIDAPEMRGADRSEGRTSRDALRERLLLKHVKICTKKDKQGKYGRYLGTVFLGEENINEWLVSQGLAEYRDY